MNLPFFLDATLAFPPPEAALKEPNGLLAIGGDLSPERLLLAYRRGIFPWYNEGEPILWWSPDPRAVLFPERLHLPRSLKKTLKKRPFEITFDTAFQEVIEACAAPRRDGPGTWISGAMKEAYARLHALGHAHSVECWQEGALVGGLYGVAVGKVFCGESMFSRRSDASKVALVHLARHLERWGFRLIDCQLPSPHLERLGAECIPRRQFLALLKDLAWENPQAPWRTEDALAS